MTKLQSYRTVAATCAALFTVLALCLLAAPSVLFWLFSQDPSASAEFLAKRAAVLFVGLALLLLWTKDHPPSETRKSIANAIAVSMLLLAALGLFEWVRGNTGAGVIFAVVTEALIAVGLAKAK